MAANTVTSTTGVVSGTDPSLVATFKIHYIQKALFLYVKYTKGNGANPTMTIGFVNPKVHASDIYQQALFATANQAAVTTTFTATGIFRFELKPSLQETQLVASFAFSTGDTQVIVCNMVPE